MAKELPQTGYLRERMGVHLFVALRVAFYPPMRLIQAWG